MFLEGVILGPLREHADLVAEYADTWLESCDIRPDSYDFANDVVSKDGGVDEWPPGEELQTAVHCFHLTIISGQYENTGFHPVFNDVNCGTFAWSIEAGEEDMMTLWRQGTKHSFG